MLGSTVLSYLRDEGFVVTGTSRRSDSTLPRLDALTAGAVELTNLLSGFHLVVNCLGYIRPADPSLEEANKCFLINSAFPHRLALECQRQATRLVHFSTDCVFTGKGGPYRDFDLPDENGIYGLSKYLGEVSGPGTLTLRTSLIGRESGAHRNLLEWFLRNTDSKVSGYSRVMWNGITTLTAARIIERIARNGLSCSGVVQIGSEHLSKYELLKLAQAVFEKAIDIVPVDQPVSNKCLVPSDPQHELFADIIVPMAQQLQDLRRFHGR